MTEPNEALIEQAKADRMQIRYDPGIPVRVFMHDGQVIWSKVDDNLADLTADNSDGLLHHVRSVFVPHGQDDPLARLVADALAQRDATILDLHERLAKAEEALREVTTQAFDYYTARNGRRCSIEGDDGEKCWIIPFDAMTTAFTYFAALEPKQ